MPTQTFAAKPEASEHDPYYSRYISQVSTDDILKYLEQQGREFADGLSRLSDSESNFRYASGKWSVKEVLGHVCDTERIFAYRALRISRGDETPMEGFEQDDYVRGGPFRHCSWTALVDEFRTVRAASLSLLRNLDEDEWLRRGVANKKEVSVRALAWILAGHVDHHRSILEARYHLVVNPRKSADTA
ncbi:MAG TPA: DinB family protein [Terriglobales bacterium]|nr:DinB family protein [Terriglobales bacterium]